MNASAQMLDDLAFRLRYVEEMVEKAMKAGTIDEKDDLLLEIAVWLGISGYKMKL